MPLFPVRPFDLKVRGARRSSLLLTGGLLASAFCWLLLGCAQGEYSYSSQGCGTNCALASPPAALSPPPRLDSSSEIPFPVSPQSYSTMSPGPSQFPEGASGAPAKINQPASEQQAAARRLAAQELIHRPSASVSVEAESKDPNAARIRQIMAAEKVQLAPADLAWSTPPKMRLTESADVELRISRDGTGGQLLASRMQPGGAVKTETVSLTSTVIASLAGQGFDLSSDSESRQSLLATGDRQWIWSIKPKSTSKGTQTLVLTVKSVLLLPGEKTETTTLSLVRDIYVYVDDSKPNVLPEFFMKNWDKLWTLLLLPAGALIIQRVRRGRVAAGESPPPPLK